MTTTSEGEEVQTRRNHNVDEVDAVETETSPESAALVRGASRSVKGAMVGRLPMTSKSASTAVSKASSRVRPAMRPRHPRSVARAPRGGSQLTSKIPTGRRANTIAKVSDRASNIFDVVSAGSESTTDTHEGAKLSSPKQATALQKLKSSLPTFQQVLTFSRVFAVNTVLGMAVYGTYEGLIERFAPVEHSDEPNHVLNSTGQIDTDPERLINKNEDAMERATLTQHFLAGSLGGASHAILSLGMEMKLVQGINLKVTNASMMNKFHLQYPTINYSLSSLFHHSWAHAVLFGSYQTTKRLLLSNITLPNNNNNYDISYAAIISIAGGIAGQLQHVTSHLSEQYLGVSGLKVSSFRRLTLPTFRSTLLAFPTSSIGFVAFEYGKLMLSADEKTTEQ